MIKLLFIAVIIFSSAGIGSVIVGEWEERRRSIGAMQSAVKVLISALGFQGMPLYDALLAAGKIAYPQFFLSCANLLRKEPGVAGKELCRKAMLEQKESLAGCKEAEKEALADLFGRLSGAVAPEQIEDAGKVFLRQTDLLAEQLRSQQEQKGRLTRTMCIVAGLVISILFV
ncbi:stage III sporulation protein AB [Christensenellaceae bacterium 44-20]